MKRLHERYIELVREGPPGLFSRGDLARLQAHVEDGIAGAATIRELGGQTLVDIGSGGGVPGLPLAIELDCIVHLVESQRWKAGFLAAAAQALELDLTVTVYPHRAEEVVPEIGRESIDVGVARALAAPQVVAEYLSPLVRVGGSLVLWSTEEQAAAAAVGSIGLLGLGTPRLRPAPSSLRSDGVHIVWPKVAPCTSRVPRRPGVAARRPLR